MRVVLKISGESLSDQSRLEILDGNKVNAIAKTVKEDN